MAEIRNYTLNFGSGRPRGRAGLTCAVRKLAFTEISLHRWHAIGSGFEGRC